MLYDTAISVTEEKHLDPKPMDGYGRCPLKEKVKEKESLSTTLAVNT